MMLITPATAALVALAIEEDLGGGDLTATLWDNVPHKVVTARIETRQAGVICGLKLAEYVARRVSPELSCRALFTDGTLAPDRALVMEVVGPAVAILMAERIMLNFMTHLSGIATLTARFVAAISGTGAQLLDTRKTTPGYRYLEKYAVRVGGGLNHRYNLGDAVMLKDNHIAAAGSITAAVGQIAVRLPHTATVEVEVSDLEMLREAVGLDLVDIIMLDNMTPAMMTAAVAINGGRKHLEASGNVNLETIAAIAATGVGYISVGAITHSAPVLDMSMVF